MALTNEERDALMQLTRQEMIQVLCNSSDALIPLPVEKRGQYLFGKLSGDRAVCLLWNNVGKECVTPHILASAHREIGQAGLQIPFVFFGPCSLVVQPDVFTFAQLP